MEGAHPGQGFLHRQFGRGRSTRLLQVGLETFAENLLTVNIVESRSGHYGDVLGSGPYLKAEFSTVVAFSPTMVPVIGRRSGERCRFSA